MKNIKTKHYYNLSWLIYILLGVIGFIVFRTLFESNIASSIYDNDINIYVFNGLMILYGFISACLVYSLGKLITGLICGYELVYFNFFIFGFEKVNNKVKMYFGPKYDFASKVVLSPKKDNVKVVLPLLGGTFGCLIAAGITYGLIFGLNATPTTKFFFIVSSLFYIFIILINLVPCRMDNLNDGFALFLISKEGSKNIYLNNMKNASALLNSNKEIIYQEVESKNDPFILEAQLYNYYYLIEKGEIEKATKIASDNYLYFKNIINEEHLKTLVIGKVYSMCLNKEFDALKEYYQLIDVNEKHYFNTTKNLESIKTALYIFSVIDVDSEEYLRVKTMKDKLKEKYKYKRFIEQEEKIIEEAIKVTEELFNNSNENKE